MKKIICALFLSVRLFISVNCMAQGVVGKDDITIRIKGYDAWADHQFFIEVYKKGKSAKIIYRYRDSVKYAEARKDVAFSLFRTRRDKYASDDPQRTALADTMSMFFEKHSAFTQDSTIINLRKDTNFNNLLERFAKATKEELAPKIEHTWLDGCAILTTIITNNRNSEIYTDTPGEATHPLLVSFISNTLNKKKDSEVIRKVLKFYVEYK